VGHREDSGRFRIGCGGNEDLPARGVGLNASSEIHRAADYAILGALLGANIAHHHLTGMNANAHIDVRQAGLAIGGIGGVQAQLHGQGAGDGPLGIVISRQGGAKQYQQTIAQNLNNRPPVGKNDVHHRLQVAIEHGHDLLGCETFGESRKTSQIRHQKGHLAQFPTELDALGDVEQLRHHVLRDVAAKRLPDKLTPSCEGFRLALEVGFEGIGVVRGHLQHDFQIITFLLQGF
jgi:hypothetical protein